MRASRSSSGQELLWLLVWLAIFVAITWLLLKFVVPHHFNDRVAVVLSGILTSILWIGLRAYTARRA